MGGAGFLLAFLLFSSVMFSLPVLLAVQHHRNGGSQFRFNDSYSILYAQLSGSAFAQKGWREGSVEDLW
uniref:Putative secreted protein n=1 Tax=Anopheles darlingi TaxID=43151 RepID=A0A2M4DEZ6_ANODA